MAPTLHYGMQCFKGRWHLKKEIRFVHQNFMYRKTTYYILDKQNFSTKFKFSHKIFLFFKFDVKLFKYL